MPSKLVLSCDGGGIRGLATNQFLIRLEEALGQPLHEVFDMFVGTSVGSIIAASIGVKKASAVQAFDMYATKNVRGIFNLSVLDKVVGVAQTDPKFDGKGKRNFLRTFFGDLILQQADKPVILTAYDLKLRRVALMRSTEPDPAGLPIKVTDACDASSGAPAYFPAVKVNDRWLVDGGVVVNNPTLVAYSEAISLWKGQDIYIISVGTGSRTRPIDGNKAVGWGGVQWIAGGLLDVAMDESVVEEVAERILGPNHVRVNSELTTVNDDMDDTTDANLQALKDLGNYWWDTFNAEVLEMINRARAH